MKITIDIDDSVYNTVIQKAESLGFETIEEYLTQLLSEQITSLKSDKEKIEKKLKDLGYM